jgi:GTP pyrophosphokinase
MLIRFATCCQPIPGDPIIGYVTRGRGVSIHRANCIEGQHLLAADRERSIPVMWKTGVQSRHEVFVEILGKDKEGLLQELSEIFKAQNINIIRASIATVKNSVRNRFLVSVKSLDQLDDVFKKIQKIKEISSVSRKIPGQPKDFSYMDEAE